MQNYNDNAELLRQLAFKYENKEFLVGDPSWFMHQVESSYDKELLAFIASSLSYGSRKQFLPKIQYILDSADGKISQWLVSHDFERSIPPTTQCFYRLYTCDMMNRFLHALADMVSEYGSMRGFVESVGSQRAIDIIKAITKWFADHNSTGVIPKDATSSCKRICMFLRWMVRTDSPVDLGLWSDLIDRRTLIMPLDTHVLQEAMRLGLISSKTASMSSALRLTDRMLEIWNDDPLKGDFALFGLGVDENAR